MSITGWIATHTGLPSVVTDATGPVYAGDRLLGTVTASTVGTAMSDPLAAPGVPVTYTQGGDTVTLTRASIGSHAMTDALGRTVTPFKWLTDDSTDLQVSASTMVTTTWQAERWPLVQPPRTFTLNALTEGEATINLGTLAIGPGLVIIFHDLSVCEAEDCDIPPMQTVVVTKASNARTARFPKAQRSWSLTCVARDGLESTTAMIPATGYGAPVVTWGEAEAFDPKWQDTYTYTELVQKIAGMPS